jgi:zinc protease
VKPSIHRFAVLGVLAAAACAPAVPVAEGPAPAGVRQAPPPPLPAREIQFPAFTETALPNGMRLIVVENRALPLARVDLHVRSGSAQDPADRLGTAELVASLLDKGTERRTAVEIAETIEGVGGTLSASADRDDVTVRVGVLSDQLPLAFDLLSDVALRPAFPAGELETMRGRQLSALQAAMGNPGFLAGRAFSRVVYGDRHPYGTSQTPETVRALGREDLVRFHRAHFTPGNALLVVSGDVTPERARELAARYFGDWSGGAPASGAVPAPGMPDATRIHLVHRPGSVQTNILVGHPALTPDNPDYYAVQVLNMVLGAGNNSRLEQVLREQRAWTYSARSAFTRPRGTGVYQANTEVRTEVTDSAAAELLAQLRRIRDEAPTAAEVEAAKAFLTASFPGRLETPVQVASQLATTRLLGLPAEHLTGYPERIRAVTVADLQRVAREYLHPDRAAVVVVGDARQVLPGLEAIAPVSLYDVEGSPLERAALEVRAAAERFSAAGLQPVVLALGVVFQGSEVGSTTLTLARDGEVWVAAQEAQVGPTVQRSETRFTGEFAPLSMLQSVQAGPVQGEVELRVEEGRIRGHAKLPPQAGGEREVDEALVAGTIFTGMETWLLAAAALAPGREIIVPLFDPTGERGDRHLHRRGGGGGHGRGRHLPGAPGGDDGGRAGGDALPARRRAAPAREAGGRRPAGGHRAPVHPVAVSGGGVGRGVPRGWRGPSPFRPFAAAKAACTGYAPGLASR